MYGGDRLVNAGGEVRVGDLVFLVRELSVAGEIGLGNRFRALAKKAMGPGSFYANARPVLDYLREQGQHADRAALMAEVSRLVATGAAASDDAAEEFRRSPDGVAEELYWRTRQTHPDATLNEFRAAVNDVNALEVHLGIMEALAPKAATTPSSSPAG